MTKRERGISFRNGKWLARVDLGRDADGKRREISKSFAVYEDAVAWRHEQLTLLRQGFVPDTRWRDRKLAEWVRHWIDSNPRSANKAGTLKDKSATLRKWVLGEGHHKGSPPRPFIASVKLKDITATHITDFLSSLPDTGVVRFKVDQALGACLLDAQRQDVIVRSPFREHSRIKYRPVRRMRTKFWKLDEVRAFLAHARDVGPVGWSKRRPSAFDGFYHAVFLLLSAGLRIGEFVSLRWDAVDLDSGWITIDTGKLDEDDDSVKEQLSERTIDLDDETIRLLQDWKKTQRDQFLAVGLGRNDTYVFTYADGRPLSEEAFRGWLDAACEASGVRRLSPHGLRHTHAVTMLNDGWDIYFVAQRLGHSVATCEKAYAKLIPGGVRNRLRKDHAPRMFPQIVSEQSAQVRSRAWAQGDPAK